MPPEAITVRDAAIADVPALTAIKGDGGEAQQYDRLRDAHGPGFRYLVLLAGKELIGYACLVYRRPAYWSDGGDKQHLPQIVDIRVKASQRGQGYGTAFIEVLEGLAAQAGYDQLYLSVDPKDNPQAYRLYQRLGYMPLQPEPYRKIWEFTDSAGKLHHGEDWIMDMVKQIAG